jgi:hypothetical protein
MGHNRTHALQHERIQKDRVRGGHSEIRLGVLKATFWLDLFVAAHAIPW